MSDIDTSGAAHAASTAGLGRKVGPLPIWGWAVLLIGGVVLFLYIRSRSSATVADNNGAGLSSTTDQTAAGALSTLYGGNGTGYQSGYSSNQAYEQAAISELSGSSQYTPLQIQTALGGLFAGDTLSADEQKIVNEVESSLGAPPEYVPTPTVTPTSNTIRPFTGSLLPSGSSLVQVVGGGPSIYVRNDSTGALQSLNYDQYRAMGSPSFSLVGANGNPFTSYVRDSKQTVYGVDASGNRQALTYPQYQQLGNPSYTQE